MNIKSIINSKKFKFGSVAVAFSCVFIAIILVINVIITALGNRFSLYVDMTGEEFYTVSQSTKEQLSGIDKVVEIVFFQEEDKIADGTELGYIKQLAKEYANEFDFIKVKYIDLISSPTAANSYKTSSQDRIIQTTVVVSCPETAKNKIIQQQGFYTFVKDEAGNVTEVYGFNGEKRFTANILQVASSQKPTALFTVGHGESASENLFTLLSEEGYSVGVIDLATQDIPKDTSLVVISNPTRDFAGLEAENNAGANEIRALNDYMTENEGNIAIFLSPKTPELPEFSEYLAEWGLAYESGVMLADSPSNTIDTENLQIISNYSGEQGSYAYEIHRSASEGGTKTICAYSTLISALPETKMSVTPVLTASASSVAVSQDTEESVPNAPLLLLSQKMRFENNDELRSNILLFGTPYFFDNAYIASNTYGNTEILYGAMKIFGNDAVSLDIPTKPFADYSLDITNQSSYTATVVLVAVMPIIVLVFGIFVWIKRKAK